MTAFGTWLLTTPIWLIAAAIYGGMILSALAGWKLRAKSADDVSPRAKSEEGYVVSSVMGLLALLVGFTFALAIDRYDTRRKLVLEEANAIGTTYLRTQLLEEPHRTRISNLLLSYTENRVDLARSADNETRRNDLKASNLMVEQLWAATVAAFPTIQTRPLSSAYIGSVNEVIDLDSARQQSRRSHVPVEVFMMLVLYQLIAAGVLGYVLAGRRGRTTASLLLILFGGALILVIDIDRPTSGGITEDQRPMEQLLETMKAQPPGTFDVPMVPPVSEDLPPQ
ncbi:hypothetical protein [Novosphingobium album (ex Hu et al. 2023)]|uniref:DUF4239 domain-containing protein n=1 Tax=Novosphingobium album (ex Hu et al. 2023) TaxID=2930093 RepID=A0ABT0B012_9SPHN|nr:hypothetical protein [Novosphingobium album (ex Hu et al. 2023)]MCJ2178388.1 hypothetical protein [Novosphingobium album (ex Hu et al. 2023)]